MKCKFCGEEVPEGAKYCPLCGETVESAADYVQPHPAEQKPINGTMYLILSILATLMCCLPLGIIGIFFSSKINSQQRSGDYAGARDSAKIARIMLIICLVFGLISVVTAIGIAAYGASGDSGTFPASLQEELSDEDDDLYADAKDDGMSGELNGVMDAQVEAAPETENLGDNWDSYTIRINGKVLALPCKYEDLAALGFSPDSAMMGGDIEDDVDGQEYEMIYLSDGKGNSVMADMINPDSADRKIEECLVAGIYITLQDIADMTITLPGEIGMDASADEAAAAYGEADEVYDEEDLTMYTWSDPDAYFSSLEMDFDAESGELVNLCLRNYGF